jgi:hypothetical protein
MICTTWSTTRRFWWMLSSGSPVTRGRRQREWTGGRLPRSAPGLVLQTSRGLARYTAAPGEPLTRSSVIRAITESYLSQLLVHYPFGCDPGHGDLWPLMP